MSEIEIKSEQAEQQVMGSGVNLYWGLAYMNWRVFLRPVSRPLRLGFHLSLFVHLSRG